MVEPPAAIRAEIDRALEVQPLAGAAVDAIEAAYRGHIYPHAAAAWSPWCRDSTQRFFVSTEDAEADWLALVPRHELQWCCAVLQRRHRHRAAVAEEATWEAYTEVAVCRWEEKLSGYDARRPFRLWLGGAFYWQARSFLRDDGPGAVGHGGADNDFDLFGSVADCSAADDDPELREAMQRLVGALRAALHFTLPAATKEVQRRVWLSYGCGRSFKEVAEHEGVTVPAVHTTLSRFRGSFLEVWFTHWPEMGGQLPPGQPDPYFRILLACSRDRLPPHLHGELFDGGKASDREVGAALAEHWGANLEVARAFE